MGVKVWIGVIVSLILIVSGFFFFWGDDDAEEVLNTSLMNESSGGEGLVKEDNLSVEISDGSKAAVFRRINLSLEVEIEKANIIRPNKSLLLNESLEGVVIDIDGNTFPIFLGSDSNLEKYEQEIDIPDSFVLERIDDNDYMDGNKSYGFVFSSGDLVLNYTIDLGVKVLWEDLVGEEIYIFGKPHEVLSSNWLDRKIELLELPYSFILSEGDIVDIESSFYDGTNFSIKSLNKEMVVLEIGGEQVRGMERGDFYYGEDFIVFVEDFWYSPKGVGSVNLIIASRKVVLGDDSLADGYLLVSFDGVEYLKEIIISWQAEGDAFFTHEQGYDLILPFFNNLMFSMDSFHRDDDRARAWDVYLEVASYVVLNETQDVNLVK